MNVRITCSQSVARVTTRMRRRVVARASALAIAALAACSGPAPRAGGPSVRVVSLHDVTTEVVVALGAADRLVGVAEPVDVEPEIGAVIAGVPRVGDLESILAVHPSIVVGMAVVAAQDPGLVARLGEAGVAVYLGDPATLPDVFALVRAVSERVGVVAVGEALAAKLEGEVRDPASETAPVAFAVDASMRPPAHDPAGKLEWPVPGAARAPFPMDGLARRVRVFVYDCCDPPFTTGGRTVLSDLIARAGGANVFGDLAAGWTHVSWEEVVARRPELIVIDAYRYEGQGDAADKQRAVGAISALARLPTLVLPLRCSLGGLRSLDGLARLRAAIGGPT